jgi:hypothetical protein
MSPAFIMTVASESPQQVCQGLVALRRAYPAAPVAMIADGPTHPAMQGLADGFGCHYHAGEQLKNPRGIWRWWLRFLELAALNEEAHTVKIDADALVHRPLTLPADPEAISGTIVAAGTDLAHVQGGFQVIGRGAVDRLLNYARAQLAQLEAATPDAEDDWASTDLALARLAQLAGVALRHYGEVLSFWQPVPIHPRQVSGFAVTHPHKLP